jgi:hypothetical protein
MKKAGLALFFLGCIFLIAVFTIQPVLKNKKAKGNHYFVPVSVSFTDENIPRLQVDIQNNKFPAELDLGFYGDVKIKSDLLEKVSEKYFIKTDSSIGWKGQKYSSRVFRTPEIKIGDLTIHPICLHEENAEFLKDSQLFCNDGSPPFLSFGRLGWKLFAKTKLFLDLGNATVIFCDRIETLKEHGYPVDTFAKTSLIFEHDLLEIDIRGSSGLLRCLLDTGSTFSILHSEALNTKSIGEQINNSDNFVKIHSVQIGGKDFGTGTFCSLPLNFPFHVDAVLGMDFFMKHQVFIDFANKEVYIKRL